MGVHGKRGLSQSYMEALKEGILHPLLELVKNDHTLDLEIRENYFNIYYRGGNLIRVKVKKTKFVPWFDAKYFSKRRTRKPDLPTIFKDESDVAKWIDAFPQMKREMDYYFTQINKDEREFQQLVVRENNISRIANGTDYYICDIEYSGVAGRFDLVALHWPSTGAARKKRSNRGLAIMEMKYGEGALRGNAGLADHIHKLDKLIGNERLLSDFADEMQMVFNQKVKLGLIPKCRHTVESMANIQNGNIDYILILANQDPASSLLHEELKRLQEADSRASIKIAMSNFTGYGLYEENIIPLDEFMKFYKEQIYSKG